MYFARTVMDSLDLVQVHLNSLRGQDKAQELHGGLVKHIFLNHSTETRLLLLSWAMRSLSSS